jgi:hypothetical protein
LHGDLSGTGRQKRLLLVQRAAVREGCQELFVASLLRWAAEQRLAEVVVVSAVDKMSNFPPSLLQSLDGSGWGASGAVVLPPATPELAGRLQGVLHERAAARGATMDTERDVDVEAAGVRVCIPAAATAATEAVFGGVFGAGCMPVYFRQALGGAMGRAVGVAGPALSCLVVFCNEGDNLGEASELAAALDALCGVSGPAAEEPASSPTPRKGRKGRAAAAAVFALPASSAATGARTYRAPGYWRALYGQGVRLEMGLFGF